MASASRDIEGNWYGMMVHYPSRGVIHVSLADENGSYAGNWDLTGLGRGPGKHGAFLATRMAGFLNVRITTRPLANAQCQLSILKEKGESMITGVIPLAGAAIPFATVTLFRHKAPMVEMSGICPTIEFKQKRA